MARRLLSGLGGVALVVGIALFIIGAVAGQQLTGWAVGAAVVGIVALVIGWIAGGNTSTATTAPQLDQLSGMSTGGAGPQTPIQDGADQASAPPPEAGTYHQPDVLSDSGLPLDVNQ